MSKSLDPARKAIGAVVQREFGVRLKAARKAKGQKQAALASALGVTRTSVSNIECGKHRVFLDQAYVAANALDIPMADLLPGLEVVFSAAGVTVAADDPISAEGTAFVTQVIADTPRRLTFITKQQEKRK